MNIWIQKFLQFDDCVDINNSLNDIIHPTRAQRILSYHQIKVPLLFLYCNLYFRSGIYSTTFWMVAQNILLSCWLKHLIWSVQGIKPIELSKLRFCQFPHLRNIFWATIIYLYCNLYFRSGIFSATCWIPEYFFPRITGRPVWTARRWYTCSSRTPAAVWLGRIPAGYPAPFCPDTSRISGSFL